MEFVELSTVSFVYGPEISHFKGKASLSSFTPAAVTFVLARPSQFRFLRSLSSFIPASVT